MFPTDFFDSTSRNPNCYNDYVPELHPLRLLLFFRNEIMDATVNKMLL